MALLWRAKDRRLGPPNERLGIPEIGNGPNTVSESAVSNSELNDFSGHVRRRRGTEICNFGRRLHWIFWIFSSGFFPFSPGLLSNLVRKSPQNVEKIARFLGGEESVESQGTVKGVFETGSECLCKNRMNEGFG